MLLISGDGGRKRCLMPCSCTVQSESRQMFCLAPGVYTRVSAFMDRIRAAKSHSHVKSACARGVKEYKTRIDIFYWARLWCKW